ncbi:MAG: YqaA family protein [Pseudomonas sp.]|nr:YqaA family protein [Pseudomonas sp.]
MLTLSAYLGLFLSALGAATLLPLQSESVLVALLLSGAYSPWALLAVASAGNTLGSLINWLLGRYLEHFRGRRWFPLNDEQLQRAQHWYARYGRWTLLLSWLPIVGDPLTLVAGIMRERLWVFLLIVSLAKSLRYAALIALTLGLDAFVAS